MHSNIDILSVQESIKHTITNLHRQCRYHLIRKLKQIFIRRLAPYKEHAGLPVHQPSMQPGFVHSPLNTAVG